MINAPLRTLERRQTIDKGKRQCHLGTGPTPFYLTRSHCLTVTLTGDLYILHGAQYIRQIHHIGNAEGWPAYFRSTGRATLIETA